jgi:rod shape-determining protein MreC
MAMRSRRTLVGALVLVALALVTLDFRETGGPVGGLQRAADAVFSPLQAGFGAVVRPIGDVVGSIFEVGTLRQRVRDLEADNRELREQLVVQADLERRLRDAEELLSMAEQQEVSLVGARVIAAPPGTFERAVVIDVGAGQGVAPAMAVVNERGVVGIVVEVTADRARVNLLSSTETGFGVRIAQTGDRGLLTGRGSDLLQLEMLDPDPDVPADAVVVTQAFQGSLVPGGLPIGALELPPDGDPSGERFLEVRPFVDLSSLGTVAVVVGGREEDGEFEDEAVIDLPPLLPPPTVEAPPPPPPSDPAATTAAPGPTPTGGG